MNIYDVTKLMQSKTGGSGVFSVEVRAPDNFSVRYEKDGQKGARMFSVEELDGMSQKDMEAAIQQLIDMINAPQKDEGKFRPEARSTEEKEMNNFPLSVWHAVNDDAAFSSAIGEILRAHKLPDHSRIKMGEPPQSSDFPIKFIASKTGLKTKPLSVYWMRAKVAA